MSVDLEQLVKIKSRLPQMDYFQILNVKQEADDEAIKEAFRMRSRNYHPDRFFRESAEAKELVSHIFRQVSIAYGGLKTARYRQMYLAKLKENRDTNLRYSPARAQENPESERVEKQTGPGAKYYKMAQKSLIARDRKSTLNNIKLALMMEKENPVYLALQAKAQELK